MEFQRKIYKKLLNWKSTSQGRKSVLIEGARRVGKSTVAEMFARNEYDSYILIDFSKTSKAILAAFDHLDNLDIFYQMLSLQTGVRLYPRKSLIVFDEIQKFPRARESTKYLVQDGRYDILSTGSLISIKENVEDIVIPSEEMKLKMYPMDFEEFILALHDDVLWDYAFECFRKKIPLERYSHEKLMRIFLEYMLVGGMPQSVDAYLSSHRDLGAADEEKRAIIELYRDDIKKAARKYSSKVSAIFEHIPASLSTHEKKIVLSKFDNNGEFSKYDEPLFWLADSMICNLCYKCNDPSVGFALNLNESNVKAYMGDTGLLVSLAFSENELADNSLYRAIMDGRLAMNKGMLYENVIAQMITAAGRQLYFYSHYNEVKKRNDIEIDFLLSNGSKLDFKVFPVEVKSSKNYTTSSLSVFSERFKGRIGGSIIIHPKNFSIGEDVRKYPPYMLPILLADNVLR